MLALIGNTIRFKFNRDIFHIQLRDLMQFWTSLACLTLLHILGYKELRTSQNIGLHEENY